MYINFWLMSMKSYCNDIMVIASGTINIVRRLLLIRVIISGTNFTVFLVEVGRSLWYFLNTITRFKSSFFSRSYVFKNVLERGYAKTIINKCYPQNKYFYQNFKIEFLDEHNNVFINIVKVRQDKNK